MYHKVGKECIEKFQANPPLSEDALKLVVAAAKDSREAIIILREAKVLIDDTTLNTLTLYLKKDEERREYSAKKDEERREYSAEEDVDRETIVAAEKKGMEFFEAIKGSRNPVWYTRGINLSEGAVTPPLTPTESVRPASVTSSSQEITDEEITPPGSGRAGVDEFLPRSKKVKSAPEVIADCSHYFDPASVKFDKKALAEQRLRDVKKCLDTNPSEEERSELTRFKNRLETNLTVLSLYSEVQENIKTYNEQKIFDIRLELGRYNNKDYPEVRREVLGAIEELKKRSKDLKDLEERENRPNSIIGQRRPLQPTGRSEELSNGTPLKNYLEDLEHTVSEVLQWVVTDRNAEESRRYRQDGEEIKDLLERGDLD